MRASEYVWSVCFTVSLLGGDNIAIEEAWKTKEKRKQK